MSDEQLAELRAANSRQSRRRGWVKRICRLGARVVWEVFEEEMRHGLVDEAALDELLAKFAAADPIALAITGGNEWPADPLLIVPAPERRIVVIFACAVEWR
jgi:hypothetical protein